MRGIGLPHISPAERTPSTMASNNYYHGGTDPPSYSANANANANPSSQPCQYDSNYPSTDQHLGQQTPYRVGRSGSHTHHPHSTGPSPFASVFDDNYATNSTNSLPHQRDYPDTTYHGKNGPGAPSHDDIPLQDRTGKTSDMNDHIYDAPEQGMAGQTRKKKKKGIRGGELGMLSSDKKKIPWVCYIFTVVQIGVFVGSIIKNGKEFL